MNYKKLFKAAINPRKFLQEEKQTFLNLTLANEGLISIHETRENDVFIVGYPKSGNTWMQSIMSCIQYGIDPESLTFDLSYTLIPDVHIKSYYQRYSKYVIFKSHDLPKERFRRVIYLVRDGRDVMISYKNHNKLNGHNVSMEDMMVNGLGLYPCKWNEHVDAWIENPYKADLMVLRYEDLLSDGLNSLNKICEFIGVKRDIAFLERIVLTLNILNMRNRVVDEGGIGKFGVEDGIKFFRKGESRSYLDEQDQDLFIWFAKKYAKQLDYFGYI